MSENVPFFKHMHAKLAKSDNMTKNKFLSTKSTGYWKKKNFMLIQIR
jgi:hypothetical protein